MSDRLVWSPEALAILRGPSLTTSPRGRGRRCQACGTRRKRVSVMVLTRLVNHDGPPVTAYWQSKVGPTKQLESRTRSFCEPCAAVLYRELVALVNSWPNPPDGGSGTPVSRGY